MINVICDRYDFQFPFQFLSIAQVNTNVKTPFFVSSVTVVKTVNVTPLSSLMPDGLHTTIGGTATGTERLS
jgi:hypothetical protein